MSWFPGFPTPYPDELLYSVLCRYHLRSGNPGMATTTRELWGRKGVMKSPHLPNNLDVLTRKLPPDSGITAESLILNNTIYPYVRPTLYRERAEALYAILHFGSAAAARTHQKAALSGRKVPLPQTLRYCGACAEEDLRIYGETYWRRLHQLPGVLVCPKHGEPILDSGVFTNATYRYYHPASPTLCNFNKDFPRYSSRMTEQLAALAEDTAWLLAEGSALGFREEMLGRHQHLLVARGFRSPRGQTKYREFRDAVIDYYGEEFLSCIQSCECDVQTSWTTQISRNQTATVQPIHHLLSMRCLSGSPQEYLETNEEPEPFGSAPWPCHNRVCPYYLKDIIPTIEVSWRCGNFKAVFTCPHCGYSYRRGRATPKEQQYEGQVRLVSFGWLWEDTLRDCLLSKKYSINRTRKSMGYPDCTIRKYAKKLNILPDVKTPGKRVYIPPERIMDYDDSRDGNRRRWLELMDDNPEMSRSQLSLKDFRTYKWLRTNDAEWYETSSPKPLLHGIDWTARDAEYLKRLQRGLDELIKQPGRPKWACKSSVANMAGIGNSIYQRLDRLPHSKTFLENHLETKDEWRKRKIRWAVERLKEKEEPLTIHRVREKCGISTRMIARLRPYFDEQIRLGQESECAQDLVTP